MGIFCEGKNAQPSQAILPPPNSEPQLTTLYYEKGIYCLPTLTLSDPTYPPKHVSPLPPSVPTKPPSF